MSKTCHIGVGPEHIGELTEVIAERNQDSVLVMPAIGNIETLSPTKKNKCHRIKWEALIPEEAIIGEGAIDDFVGFVVMMIPKKRIKDEYLNNSEAEDKEKKAASQAG